MVETILNQFYDFILCQEKNKTGNFENAIAWVLKWGLEWSEVFEIKCEKSKYEKHSPKGVL